MTRILTLRELNRATLSRQMLLERSTRSPTEVIARLFGMQAQDAFPPFVGLWTRLVDFTRDDLATLIENRTVVKATTMRGTLHLLTAADYLHFRTTLQPVLTRGAESANKAYRTSFDTRKVLTAAREFIAEKPRTFAEIGEMAVALMSDVNDHPMRTAVRSYLPLIQVPNSSEWCYPGNPAFTLAETWLGQPISAEDDLRGLVRRYLAAFGPASVNDMQTWSGLLKLKDVFESMRDELQVYRGENKRELFDLPDTELPDGDTPVPVRFLPEFDNLLLSHDKRTRVLSDEYRPKVFFAKNGRIPGVFLVDGFVAGLWRIEHVKKAATLTIEPFHALPARERDTLAAEAEPLLRFSERSAESFEVRFSD